MSEKIENAGKFTVKIVEALHKPNPKDDDPHAFTLLLKGETPDGLYAWGSLYYNHNIRSSGKSQGMSGAQVAAQTLADIGVPDGYIGNLAEAIESGLECTFVMKWDEWLKDDGTTEKSLKVAFINPVSKTIKIEDINYDSLMMEFDGKAAEPSTPPPITSSPVATATTAGQALDQDEIPF